MYYLIFVGRPPLYGWCELFLQGALDDCELSLARDPNYVKVMGVIKSIVSAISFLFL